MSLSRTPGFRASKMSWYTPSTMAQAWREQRDLVLVLDPRAFIITCWPSRTSIPAACSSRNTDVSARSTPRGMSPDALLASAPSGSPRRRASAGRPTGRDGALQAGVAADRVLGVVQWGSWRRWALAALAEVPDPGPAGARDQRVALTLVERPVPDVGAGGVADVARLEQQDGPEVGGLERLAHAGQPVLPQPFGVDAVLPVDDVEPGRRSSSPPGTVLRPSPRPSVFSLTGRRRRTYYRTEQPTTDPPILDADVTGHLDGIGPGSAGRPRAAGHQPARAARAGSGCRPA